MPVVPRFLAFATLFALLGCSERPSGRSENNLGQPAPEANTVAPELPAVEAPLTRRDILLAVTEAASRFAIGGEAQTTGPEALDGRTFSFRIRFCDQSSPNFMSSVEPETRVLKAEARPDIDRDSPEVQQIAGSAAIEDVDGFWVPRPWLLEAACPRLPTPQPDEPEEGAHKAKNTDEQQTPPAPAHTVGIVQFHSEDSARSARREQRPYSVTKKLGDAAPPKTIDLVLQGRLQRAPGGKVITCSGNAVSAPPTCLVSVRIDQVRMEADSGELLAEWSKG